MHVEAQVVGQPALHGGRLVGGVVVADQVNIEAVGDLGVDGGQELAELDGAVAPVQGGDDGAVGDVEGGEQAGGARADVVVGAFSGVPGIMGNAGGLRSRAWIWGFSSTRRRHVGLGRFQVEPGDVTDLVTISGSWTA